MTAPWIPDFAPADQTRVKRQSPRPQQTIGPLSPMAGVREPTMLDMFQQFRERNHEQIGGLMENLRTMQPTTADDAMTGLGMVLQPESLRYAGWQDIRPSWAKPKPITAWHGTPHDFDRFTIKNLGGGEGNAMITPGLYFADQRPVATQYRRNLSYREDLPWAVEGRGGPLELGTRGTPETNPINLARHHPIKDLIDTWYNRAEEVQPEEIGSALRQEEGFLREVTKEPLGAPERHQTMLELLEKIRRFNDWNIDAQTLRLQEPGHLYEVELDADPQRLLNWDVPVRDQTREVRQALGDAGQYWERRAPSPALKDRGPSSPIYNDRQLEDVFGINSGYTSPTAGASHVNHSAPLKLPGLLQDLESQAHQFVGDNPTWKERANRYNPDAGEVYPELANKRSTHLWLESMRKAGLHGVKFRNARTRQTPNARPQYNYVMFDPNRVKILNKLAAALSAGLGADALSQPEPEQ